MKISSAHLTPADFSPEGMLPLPWQFFVRGYKCLSQSGDAPVDWYEGGIILQNRGEQVVVDLPLLIMEDLEDFVSWMNQISRGIMAPDSFFLFMDGMLCFQYSVKKNGAVLQLMLGYDELPDYLIESHLPEALEMIDRQMTHIRMLLKAFPCRCRRPHNLATISNL